MKKLLKSGVTLLELIVVLLIIALLSGIAVGVYTKEVLRARYARARAEIKTLEVAVNRYQIDTGQYPPSSSGSVLAGGFIIPDLPTAGFPNTGNGYLQLCLRSSLNGNVTAPLDRRWQGPYVEWDYNKMGDINGDPVASGIALPRIQFLDPFGEPYLYIRSQDYETYFGTKLPATHPFSATETYFNPTTFQIVSFGNNRTSDISPFTDRGTEADDVSNFVGSDY